MLAVLEGGHCLSVVSINSVRKWNCPLGTVQTGAGRGLLPDDPLTVDLQELPTEGPSLNAI